MYRHWDEMANMTNIQGKATITFAGKTEIEKKHLVPRFAELGKKSVIVVRIVVGKIQYSHGSSISQNRPM
jgi:hypothetical protein